MISPDVMLPLASVTVRDQGQRNTCLAFALCAMSHAYSPHSDGLSPEYLYLHAASLMTGWFPGSGLSLDAGLAASAAIAIEIECPYQTSEPQSPLPPLPSGLRTYGAQANRVSIDPVPLIEKLKDGKPVGLGLMLTNFFYKPEGGRVLDGGDVIPGSAHAVVATGLAWDSEDPIFLIRNSWGQGWGEGGSAWITSEYIQKHTICAFGV